MRFRRSSASLWIPEGHRLTLESGVSVSTTDQLAKGTLYSTPHPEAAAPNWMAVSDGNNFYPYEYGEISKSLTLTNGKNYDIFRSLSAGAPVLTLSSAWTTDLARADAVSLLKGKYVLTSDKTFVLVGTIRANGTNTTEGSSTNRLVFNLYNPVSKPLFTAVVDVHTYNAAAFRSWNNDATHRVTWVNGIPIFLTGFIRATFQSDATSEPQAGLYLDGTDSVTIATGSFKLAAVLSMSSVYPVAVAAGFHFLQTVERNIGAAGTATFNSYVAGADMIG